MNNSDVKSNATGKENKVAELKMRLNARQLAIVSVATRNCYKIKLLGKTTSMIRSENGKTFTKTVWYFPKDSLPENYPNPDAVVTTITDEYGREVEVVPAGVESYDDFFYEEELKELETM